jgi:hypothetical protein
VFNLRGDIETFNYSKLNVESLDGIPRIFEDGDEDDAYIYSLDSGNSEYDLDYIYIMMKRVIMIIQLLKMKFIGTKDGIGIINGMKIKKNVLQME